jgi:ubiquinone/menaquinone biosynthesis C-methylase UbiE
MNKYSKMQESEYEHLANYWSIDSRDAVVGSFDQHNAWSDYDEFLFKGIETENLSALEFGCGPGRNIVRFNKRFAKIDGVDIAQKNLDNAKLWMTHNNISLDTSILYKNDGANISIVPSETYDVVYSTICFQHICVHEIRYSLLEDFYRVLKPGGHICFQQGLGNSHPSSVGYFENFYDAHGTNSALDHRLENVDDLKNDLEKIGFHNFEYDMRPVGPGDAHTNWIFWRAEK